MNHKNIRSVGKEKSSSLCTNVWFNHLSTKLEGNAWILTVASVRVWLVKELKDNKENCKQSIINTPIKINLYLLHVFLGENIFLHCGSIRKWLGLFVSNMGKHRDLLEVELNTETVFLIGSFRFVNGALRGNEQFSVS